MGGGGVEGSVSLLLALFVVVVARVSCGFEAGPSSSDEEDSSSESLLAALFKPYREFAWQNLKKLA